MRAIGHRARTLTAPLHRPPEPGRFESLDRFGFPESVRPGRDDALAREPRRTVGKELPLRESPGRRTARPRRGRPFVAYNPPTPSAAPRASASGTAGKAPQDFKPPRPGPDCHERSHARRPAQRPIRSRIPHRAREGHRSGTRASPRASTIISRPGSTGAFRSCASERTLIGRTGEGAPGHVGHVRSALLIPLASPGIRRRPGRAIVKRAIYRRHVFMPRHGRIYRPLAHFAEHRPVAPDRDTDQPTIPAGNVLESIADSTRSRLDSVEQPGLIDKRDVRPDGMRRLPCPPRGYPRAPRPQTLDPPRGRRA